MRKHCKTVDRPQKTSFVECSCSMLAGKPHHLLIEQVESIASTAFSRVWRTCSDTVLTSHSSAHLSLSLYSA
jgi:hypothetical protein